MCFGNEQTSSQTTTPSAAVTGAANSNLDFVKNLQSKGFQGYGGQQVANLDPAQQGTITNAAGTANNGTYQAATGLIGGYAGAPAQNVNYNSIASNMSPYMNQYVMSALAPQLQQQDTQFAKNAAAINGQATGAGAFGDARTGIEQATNTFNNNVAREGLIGNAYNSAFNTAIGAGAQDSSGQFGASTANAGYNETALNRMLGGATALQGAQQGQLGADTTANTMTQQDTAQAQANLTAQYNQWLMAQQYPFQTAGLMNSTIGAANPASPTTTTKTEPDNSGYAMLGTALGVGAKFLPASDIRLKEDIEPAGALKDGTPLYLYNYKNDPRKIRHVGVMAQDVEKIRPDAVHEAGGFKFVDYEKATERSRLMSIAV